MFNILCNFCEMTWNKGGLIMGRMEHPPMIGLVSRFFTVKNMDKLLQPAVLAPVTPIQNHKSVH